MTRWAIIVIGIVAAVVITALVAAVLGGPDDEETGDVLAYGEVQVTGASLAPLGDPADDPAVGAEAPVLEGVGLDGEPVTVRPGQNGTVLLFLAHWCPHCQNEVPRVQEWIDQTGGEPGVDLYGVATATDPARPNYPPGAWLEREGWTPPVLLDDEEGTAGQAYGVTSYPFWVVLAPEGTVAARFSGELGREGIERLFQEVARLGA